eukprot:552278-Hanusia_phi.AAC.4
MSFCTFKPEINCTSRRLVERRARRQEAGDAKELDTPLSLFSSSSSLPRRFVAASEPLKSSTSPTWLEGAISSPAVLAKSRRIVGEMERQGRRRGNVEVTNFSSSRPADSLAGATDRSREGGERWSCASAADVSDSGGARRSRNCREQRRARSSSQVRKREGEGGGLA